MRNVNSHDDFESCKTFCFDLYQGNFFGRPETLSMNRLDPGRARVMEIFNLVINRADIGAIEDAFKHDVALCYSLLCYINSVGIGLQYKVSSIRDAVMLLGYDFLWRWLSLLIFAGVDLTAAQRVLLPVAFSRVAAPIGPRGLGGLPRASSTNAPAGVSTPGLEPSARSPTGRPSGGGSSRGLAPSGGSSSIARRCLEAPAVAVGRRPNAPTPWFGHSDSASGSASFASRWPRMAIVRGPRKSSSSGRRGASGRAADAGASGTSPAPGS